MDGATFLEVHKVHSYREISQREGREEGLVGTRSRYPKVLVRVDAFVFVAEVNHVRWLVGCFCQVPNLEVFVLVDDEELTETSCEPRLVISEVLRALEVLVVFVIIVDVLVFKVKQTPFDLSVGKLTLVVPY